MRRCQPSFAAPRAVRAANDAAPKRAARSAWRSTAALVALPDLDCYASRVTTARARRLFVIVIGLALATRGATPVATAADAPTRPGAPHVTGPPAPAVPAVAATPEPAAAPALPDAPHDPDVAARAEPIAPPAPGAKPRSVNLWPLFTYESDPASHTKHVQIFGPLIEYRADAERQAIFVRPFVSIDQSRIGHDDHVSILGPVLTSHWGQTEQETKGLGGLFTYRTRTSADGRTLEMQNARLLPVYFYEWDQRESAGKVSVLPVYADLDDFLGYEHVDVVAFPAYVHVKKGPTLDRSYYPYPIISRDGPEGSGYRLWPFPLRDRQGRRIGASAAGPVAADASAGDAGCDSVAAGETACETYFPLMRDELDAAAPARDADPS